MSVRRRYKLAAAGALVPALLLTACGTSASPSAKKAATSIASVKASQLRGVTISTADFFGDCSAAVGKSTDLSKAHAECPTFQTLINMFNAGNKWGIKVTQTGADWKSYYDSLNAAFAAKNPPDVSLMHESNIPDYSSRGLLLPLGADYKLAGIDPSDFTPAAQDAVTVGKTIYAVPFDEHAEMLHLNMTLMKQAGLVNADGSPVLPRNPSQLMQQAAQFKARTGKQYMAWGSDFDIPFRIFSTFVAQQGQRVVSDNGKVNINTSAGRNALNLMKKIYSAGVASPHQTYDASQSAWLNGNVGMLVDGTWAVNQYNSQAKFQYRAGNFPTLFSKPAIWANAHTWVIPVQQHANPVKYRAALDFASWMYQHDQDWAIGSGHLSVRKSVINSASYKASPQRTNYIATTQFAALDPQVVGWQAGEDALEHGIEPVWLSNGGVGSALSQTQSAVASALKRK